MNINWRIRIKNKAFWLALIPAVLLLVQVVAAVFGYTLDLGDLGNKLLAVVNAVFAVLSILGIVTDPTTAGIGDSPQAMTYEEPKQNPYNYNEPPGGLPQQVARRGAFCGLFVHAID